MVECGVCQGASLDDWLNQGHFPILATYFKALRLPDGRCVLVAAIHATIFISVTLLHDL